MPFFVYILYSKGKNKYYTGHTDNLDVRLSSHTEGLSPYTSSAKDWILKCTEQYYTRAEAIQREKEIKRKKSKKYIEWLISNKGNSLGWSRKYSRIKDQ